jgi:hypothetical protein
MVIIPFQDPSKYTQKIDVFGMKINRLATLASTTSNLAKDCCHLKENL